jgi:hypothetical protein
VFFTYRTDELFTRQNYHFYYITFWINWNYKIAYRCMKCDMTNFLLKNTFARTTTTRTREVLLEKWRYPIDVQSCTENVVYSHTNNQLKNSFFPHLSEKFVWASDERQMTSQNFTTTSLNFFLIENVWMYYLCLYDGLHTFTFNLSFHIWMIFFVLFMSLIHSLASCCCLARA